MTASQGAAPGTPVRAADVVPVRRAAQVRRLLGRAAGSLLALGLVAGVVVVGVDRPSTGTRLAPAIEVAVPVPTSTLVCPGPVRLPTEPEPGQDVSYDPQFDPAPGDSATSLRAVGLDGPQGRLLPIGHGRPAEDGAADAPGDGGTTEGQDEVLAELGGSAVVGLEGVETGSVLEVAAAGEDPVRAAAAVGVTTLDGDLRGLAAASCQRPGTESWLVGGSTELGSSARLVLQNPGRTAATVAVELWGPAGPVSLAGAPQYLVPAGAERVVLLEGVAAEQRRIVVRLTASGGVVTGYVQDSSLRGLVPAGVDLVVAGQGPALEQVLPGIVLPEEAAGADGAEDAAQVRVLAPGTRGTTVSVTLLGPEGAVELPGAQDVALGPGEVLDVPVAGVPPGPYTAVVTAGEPVVAGALLTRGLGVGRAEGSSTHPLERAWVPSVPIGVEGPVALPAGPGGGATVAVVPDPDIAGPAEVTVEAIASDGTVLGTRDLSVGSGATLRVWLASFARVDEGSADTANRGTPAALVVRTDDPRVAWGVVLTVAREDGQLIGFLAPVPPEPARAEVSVRVR